ncbi:two-component system, OmpR family, phosphate regulon sensor histidine kinase PhoR [Pseudovibrio ascidiaceicola]|uniref:histidine kinase n=1 Tax=Pseudovibrio ascidiaceicola TaxID=285279 RepID=A0A1I3WUL4_9HYPH|nr:ATP-binding protein [Pseudovibrio ascidiaceicola]SFK10121.1 two-component system, OmpR family, phosphate regulon sensor histidine kinase PhoR [Pseudovibrio ascidiaceicola]
MSLDTDKEEKHVKQEPLRLGLNRRAVYRKPVDVRWILLASAGIFALFSIAFDVPVWASFFAYALIFVLVIGGGMKSRTKVKAPSGVSRKEASEIVDRGMKSAVNALPDPCFVVDYRGTTQYVNLAAQRRFGTIAVGDPLSFRIRAPSLLEALDRVSNGGSTEVIDWTEKVPMELWLEAHIAPLWSVSSGNLAVPRGRPGLILVVIRDLTEARRLERMRADFVANASHELRTPLASLTGFIETLQGPAKGDPKAQDQFLGIMLDQAERMRRLIDDLLSLSRIEMKVHVQPETLVDLSLIMRHSVETLLPVAKESGVEVNVNVSEEPAEIRGEKDELVQVFSNLIENALKYGSSGGRVDVTCRLDPDSTETPHWIAEVRDFGPGIDPEHLPRLTERFYRVDVVTSRQMKGTGLGLAIVKHILTRHRARLEIESKPDEGACFRVFIPGAVIYDENELD